MSDTGLPFLLRWVRLAVLIRSISDLAHCQDPAPPRIGDAPADRSRRLVELMASTMGEHRGWTIRVTPQAKDEDWRALVEVWPPELSTRTHGGMVVPFSASAEDEPAIVAGATDTS